MMAGKWETTCLLDVAGKDMVKASDQVPVEGKKAESSAPEPVIKAGGIANLPVGWRKTHCPCKRKIQFLVDRLVRVKPASPNMNLTLFNTPWRSKNDSWWME